ncbi:sulfatase family protein [Pelagicoccus mobilis]|uniref:Sulfatase n=1 Tax=Pelagicoccus mobilis TaxID=415221 RepID=A0A934RZN5_9BACT|nr:sulfatase [Pelagicoccus mobilis]MBK1877242.1 sulfatase [Pelagicoccus mobilis]
MVIIFLDDAGWSDFHPFGDPEYETPHVQRLAEEGCRYNSFFVPQAVCSASRSALLSGAYPGRTKVFGAHGPLGRGLEPKFAILSEVLKGAGYKTALFGKWHIGDQPDTRPHARGFDETAGLMYSNDMWEHHPTDPETWGKHPLQYWENGDIVVDRVTPEFQRSLTTRATERAVDFIERHKDKPFFLYVPHSMPHVPLYVSDKFEEKSGVGLYGDVIMELDWSVGEIDKALERSGVKENTIVIFSSDNGPWTGYGNHAGVTPFREAKTTGFNGGTQSPCIIRYPGKIEAGSSSDRTFCSVDLLPTICRLTGASLPENEIDGKDVWPLLVGEKGVKNPHKYYPFSTVKEFQGVISGNGRWKLHLPHGYRIVKTPGMDGVEGEYGRHKIELSLFDLKKDPGETTNVIADFPEVAERLQKLAAKHRARFYE